ncbi:aldo/keto reductase [Oceanidesulfovibrio marinus]|uniref:Aldo/keto reductase n=1 Tax=Oceanidesulfovibrio marinus TaxID=370038 RepID=A0A6P1ZMS0_9BACT|nr:aldo/keto reductase [Oceanidesulfovibrio marinus]QJT08341.1 aldo/keto reductase [Oceanidesulfovibrio marinus]TVM35229.1 general stress protein [Oceanidesulfovibrio marinus]
MEFVTLPGTDVELSRIALGTWAIGGWMWGGSDEQESIKTIHAALDKGVTTLDTAPVYGFGRSEEIVGKAIKQYPDKDKIRISTKVALDWTGEGKVFRNSTPERIQKEVEDSLRRLGVDVIDVYFIHWPDTKTPFEDTAATMCKLKEQGKIRAVAVSNYSPSQMDAFGAACSLQACQPPYNLFERAIDEDILPYCKDKGIVLVTYGALCRGLLSGKMRKDREFQGDDLRKADPKFQEPRYAQYLAAVDKLKTLARERCGKDILPFAVRWVLDRTGGVALWGGRRPDQMDPIPDILGWSIDTQTMAEVDRILDETITDPVGPEFMAPPERA